MINQKYNHWLKSAKDEETQSALLGMKDNQSAINNAFFRDLEFGTGGLRGELGTGTNCLNIYTVAKATKGLADYMSKHGYKTAAISYDSRIKSDEFCRVTARVLAANGITVYVTKDVMPTPFLSYITRECNAQAGVMITASHNPAKYNGYKVYNSDGYQLTDENSAEVSSFIKQVDEFGIVSESFDYYIDKGLIKYIDDKLIESYLSAVASRSLNTAEGISIIYTPLNGTGYKLVPEILKRRGVRELSCVPEQSYPDGNFTTCPSPNPEKPEALALGLKLIKEKQYDLLLATDPDSDRIGAAVRHNGEYKLLSGNETGILLADYLFGQLSAQNKLPQNPVLVKTIVSTPLPERMLKKYNAQIINVLTGFKYIGEHITALEKQGQQSRYVLGFEESYGYLSGTHVRDKDAVEASMLIAEMAATLKKSQKTLIDRLNEIYTEFGCCEHKLISKEYHGAEGSAKIAALMDKFRTNPPKALGESKVTKVTDYLESQKTGLPPSNVLSIEAESGARLIVRPSGTEPLIKFYLSAYKTATCTNAIENIAGELDKIFNS